MEETMEKVMKCAKIVVRNYKEEMKRYNGHDEKPCLVISANLYNEYDSKIGKYVLQFSSYDREKQKKTVINFGVIDFDSQGFADITRMIADAAVKMLNVNTEKNAIHYNTYKCSGGSIWNSYTYSVYESVDIIPLCKEFKQINRRLNALGLKTIPVEWWTHGGLFGKRSSCSKSSTFYFASNKDQCDKVLAYLKGKKKMQKIEFVESRDDDDMRRGIEYETEWYGSYRNYLKFIDSKGKCAVIY